MEELTEAAWRTSRYSGANGGQCVEVGRHGDKRVLVRDTKNRACGTLRFSPRAWRRFVGLVKAGA